MAIKVGSTTSIAVKREEIQEFVKKGILRMLEGEMVNEFCEEYVEVKICGDIPDPESEGLSDDEWGMVMEEVQFVISEIETMLRDKWVMYEEPK